MKTTITIKGKTFELSTRPSSMAGWVETVATLDGVIVQSTESGGSASENLRSLKIAVHDRYCGCGNFLACEDPGTHTIVYENPGIGRGLAHEHELDDGTAITFTIDYVSEGLDADGVPIDHATHIGVCWAYRPDAAGLWVKLPVAEAVELARANLADIEERFVDDESYQAELQAEG